MAAIRQLTQEKIGRAILWSVFHESSRTSFPSRADKEEAESQAIERCLAAVKRWRPEQAGLTSYLCPIARGTFKHWFRDHFAMIRNPGYRWDKGLQGPETELRPTDELPDGEESWLESWLEEQERQEKFARLRKAFIILNNREREVAEGLLAGKTVREIAKEHGVKVGCVHAQRMSSVRKLREHFQTQ